MELSRPYTCIHQRYVFSACCSLLDTKKSKTKSPITFMTNMCMANNVLGRTIIHIACWQYSACQNLLCFALKFVKSLCKTSFFKS